MKNKIYGCIPVGGNGNRLKLPFSKEMLPLLGYNFYKPVIEHTVNKMEEAGCNKIIIIHGKKNKKDILKYFPNYKHICQENINPFVLNDILKFISNGILLYGLPDTIYTGNPFIEAINIKGHVACIFETLNDNLKVDRINKNKFDVKSEKTLFNQNKFWGAAKFIIEDMPKNYTGKEVGEYLNLINVNYSYNKEYVDLGTWLGYEEYCNNYKIFL